MHPFLLVGMHTCRVCACVPTRTALWRCTMTIEIKEPGHKPTLLVVDDYRQTHDMVRLYVPGGIINLHTPKGAVVTVK